MTLVYGSGKESINFDPTLIHPRHQIRFVDYRGESHPSTHFRTPPAEAVLQGQAPPILANIPFTDPNYFIAGKIHTYYNQWCHIVSGPDREKHLNWVLHGVNLHDFIRPYTGYFEGQHFDSEYPPPRFTPNARICDDFVEFIGTSIKEDLFSGAISLVGKIGEVTPPYIVSPLTVEPTKPRLCLDLRFLNCWMRDTPFSLDTLVDIPRIIHRGSYMTKLDDKSGYKNMLVHTHCKNLLGFQWAGMWYQYNTVPFGWKNAAFCYHSLNSQVSTYLKANSVPILTYIDDRWIEEWYDNGIHDHLELHISPRQKAMIALYATCQVVCRVGYCISLQKSQFIPQQVIIFLGLAVHSRELAFSLPNEKKKAFSSLREYILGSPLTHVRSLQKFAGKCVSFLLAIPGAKLFTSEVNRAISLGTSSRKPIPVTGALKVELQHWRFLDLWDTPLPWQQEKHVVVKMSSDASNFKWGARLGEQVVGDYWTDTEMILPIMAKEAKALHYALIAFDTQIKNSRVDAWVDNKAFIDSWNKHGSRSGTIILILKDIFMLTFKNNIRLELSYICSADNPADAPSRRITKGDSMLSPVSWLRVNQILGGPTGHSVDGMSLDSNCMKGHDGKCLRHFTPCHTPNSSGVNIFAQTLCASEQYYVFPPFNMIHQVLNLFSQAGLPCTIVVPVVHPAPPWSILLQKGVTHWLVLGNKGAKGVLLYPSKQGFHDDKSGLPWMLIAVKWNPEYSRRGRVKIPLSHVWYHMPTTQSYPSIMVVGDSIIRALKTAMPHKSPPVILSISGATLRTLLREVATIIAQKAPDVVIIHAGTNNINKLNKSEDNQMSHFVNEWHALVSFMQARQSQCNTAFVISGILHTKSDIVNARVDWANRLMSSTCTQERWKFVSHDDILTMHLRDFVHLNEGGVNMLLHSLQDFIA